MRSFRRESGVGVAFVVLGVLLLLDGLSILAIWLSSLRCSWGVACVWVVIYPPSVPFPLLAAYLALFLLGAFGGRWSYEEWKRSGVGKTRRPVRWLAVTGLLLATSAWSGVMWILTLLAGHALIIPGPASNLAILAFYVLLIAMPLVAASVGSTLTVDGVRRRPSAGA